MAAFLPRWSKPSTILFATEFPANEKAFAFALAVAAEFHADLFLFHAYDSPSACASESSESLRFDLNAARVHKKKFEPLAQRAGNLGVRCKIVVRPGSAAGEILHYVRERKVDRIIMGAHCPGPVGKLLVGSVAEAVLRDANVPVSIVGPEVIEDAYRRNAERTVLCSVSEQESSRIVVRFAAELAARQGANLILQQVIPPQQRVEILAGRSLEQIEDELLGMVPPELAKRIEARTRVVFGDPTEELLYQGRAERANLIVMGAQGASHFAAITRAGVVYKVLAYARCPVVTLSPVVLAECGAAEDHSLQSEACLAGIF